MAAKNMIGCMQSNDKLDGINYDIWHLKVQFTLNDGDMLDLLTSSMPALADKDEQDRDIIATEQYQESLRHTKHGLNMIILHATQYCLACRMIFWVSLNASPLLKTCGHSLRLGSGRHLL